MQNQDSNSELRLAYADCWMRDEREGMRRRSLDFRDNRWLELDGWEDEMLLACPDGYNDFDARTVASALRAMLDNDAAKIDSIGLQAAREGSVACYISGPLEILTKIVKLRRALFANEAHIDSNEQLRLWWD